MIKQLVAFILTYIFIYIIESNSRVLVRNCDIKQTRACEICDSRSADLCSLSATFRVIQDINLEERNYSYRWFFNGTRKTDIINAKNSIFEEYTGTEQMSLCLDKSVCKVEIQTHLHIPKPSSRLNTNGNYTILIRLSTTPKEELSCSTLVCVNRRIGKLDEDLKGNDRKETHGIVNKANYVTYILAGVAVFVIVVVIAIRFTVKRRRSQVQANKTRVRLRDDTQGQMADEPISFDDTTVVSSHAYATVKKNRSPVYQNVLEQIPEKQQHDQPSTKYNSDLCHQNLQNLRRIPRLTRSMSDN